MRRYRKTVSLLLALAMLLGSWAGVLPRAEAAAVVASGTCGEDLDGDWIADDNLTWTLDAEGTLTVSGTGKMMDWPTWDVYADQIVHVILEDGVTSVGSNAFYGCGVLKSVSFGKDVAYLGDRSFAESGLESVAIPDSVTAVGSGVFQRSALRIATVGKGLSALGSSMFSYTPLEKVTLSEGLLAIGVSAFNNCFNLSDVVIPEGVTTIGISAFNTCASMDEISLPSTLETVQNNAFNMCFSLQTVNFYGTQEQWSGITVGTNNANLLAASVYYLGGHTHDFSTGVPVVVEPTCTEAGSKTYFCTCGMTRVETIPATGHKEVTEPGVEPTCSANGWTEGSYCETCGEVIKDRWYLNPTGHREVTTSGLAPTCTQPGLTSYTYCSVCSEMLSQPEQILALGHNIAVDEAVSPNCMYPGKTEGSHCTRCGEVLVGQEEIPATGHTEVTDPAVEPGCTYMGMTEGKHCGTCGTVLIAQEWIPARHKEQDLPAVAPTCTTTGLTAGKKCSQCGEILVAQEMLPIADHSFANGSCINCKLPYIQASGTVGDGVTWTLDYAYTLTISGVGYMNSYAYATQVPWYNYRWYVKKIVVDNGVTAIGDCAFFECREVTEVTLPASVYAIGESAFNGCAKLARISIPASVGEIGDAAFYGCSALQSIELPQRLTSISTRTFMKCTSLTTVTVPAMVTVLDVEAFKECSALESVYLPDGLQIIGDGSFCECRSLALADIPETVIYVGRESFKYCEGIPAIYIPNSVERIGEFAFCGCISATSAVVSEKVTVFDQATFMGCKALKEVTLPGGMVSIDRYAFDVTALEKVYFNGSCDAWKQISIAGMNDPLNAAYIQCSDGHIHSYVEGLCKWCALPGVLVVHNGEQAYCDSLTEALEMTPDGYIRLYDDVTEDVSVAADANLDMNGCSLNGDITVEDGAILYLFDSATADYTAESRGRVVGNINGEVARCFNTPDTNYKYMVIQEEDGSWSSHRYYLSVRSVLLTPYVEGYGTAVNYKTVFKCNEVAASYILQYGLKLTGDNTVYADHMQGSFTLLSGAENTNTASTFLVGIMKPENTAAQNAANALQTPAAQAYIRLSDGTELTSAAVQVSAKELIAAAVASQELTQRQKGSLGDMYTAFSEVLDTWTDVDVEVLRQYARQYSGQTLAVLPADTKQLAC